MKGVSKQSLYLIDALSRSSKFC